jgi:uncharacterized protein
MSHEKKMMNQPIKLSEIQEMLVYILPEIIQKYHVESLGIFGSYIRSEETQESDLDLLVSFKSKPGLLKYIELENYLTDQLGVKVDLVMHSALKPRIGEKILEEVVYL